MWALDSGGQVVGKWDIHLKDPIAKIQGSIYEVLYGDMAVYIDLPESLSPGGGDEGASPGDEISVVVQDLSNNIFYEAYFVGGPHIAEGYQGTFEKDIMVTNNIIPETSTGLLALLGAGALLKKRRK